MSGKVIADHGTMSRCLQSKCHARHHHARARALVLLRGEKYSPALSSRGNQVSGLCYTILAVLSQNRHIAQIMSSEPSLRAVLVGELRRQVKGWNSNPHDHTSGSSSIPGTGSEEEVHSSPGDMVGESVQGVSAGAGGGAATERGSVEERQGSSRPPPASIVVDPIHLTITLETLRNVMRASRRRNREESSAEAAAGIGVHSGADGGWGSETTGQSGRSTLTSEEEGVPWPFRSLYGEDNYHGRAEGGGGSYGAEAADTLGEEPIAVSSAWPLDRKLVADIAELMLSAASVRGNEAVSAWRTEFMLAAEPMCYVFYVEPCVSPRQRPLLLVMVDFSLGLCSLSVIHTCFPADVFTSPMVCFYNHHTAHILTGGRVWVLLCEQFRMRFGVFRSILVPC